MCDLLHPVGDKTKDGVHNMHPHAKNNDNIEELINMKPEKNVVPNFRQVTLERLLVLRYSSHQCDNDIRRLYIKLWPYQLQKSKYGSTLSDSNGHCVIFYKLVLKTFDRWKPPLY